MMEPETTPRTLRILLVDDHELVRLGIRALLEQQSDLMVAGEALSADEAVEKTRSLQPDIVLMDTRLHGRSGIEACHDITHERPDVRVILLASSAEDELLVEAIAAGAVGYVPKQIGSERLLEVIRAVGRGESFIDPSMTGQLFAQIRESVERERREAFNGLTDQELRILAMLTEGKSNRQIGKEIALSEKTVRNYVSSILTKLQLASRTEAAAYAVRYHVEHFLEE